MSIQQIHHLLAPLGDDLFQLQHIPPIKGGPALFLQELFRFLGVFALGQTVKLGAVHQLPFHAADPGADVQIIGILGFFNRLPP